MNDVYIFQIYSEIFKKGHFKMSIFEKPILDLKKS